MVNPVKEQSKGKGGKKKKNSKPITGSYTSSMRSEEQAKRQADLETRLKATKKHMEEISNIKQQTNERLLPSIGGKT